VKGLRISVRKPTRDGCESRRFDSVVGRDILVSSIKLPTKPHDNAKNNQSDESDGRLVSSSPFAVFSCS